MAKKKKTSKTKVASLSSEEVKNNILRCAKQEFAVRGVQGANLKDIAHCAGVAGSLITYHYKGKDGLFKSCIESFAIRRIEAINRLLNAEPKSREEMQTRIELFVEELLLSFVADPDGFHIVNQEAKSGNPVAIEIFRETFLGSFENAIRFFAKAKEHGVIDASRDPLIIASLLFSLTCETARNDHLGELFYNVTIKDENRRKLVAEHIVSTFMNGVAK